MASPPIVVMFPECYDNFNCKHKLWTHRMLQTRGLKKIALKIGQNRYFSYKTALVTLLFMVLGTLTILLTHASSSSISVEAESGNLSGNVSKITDSTASGGQAVQFGSNVSSGTAYNPDIYCWYHVMGSLFGDGQGNGPPNGASWNTNNTSWSFSEPTTSINTRFQRCAKYMITNNIGNNGGATLSVSGNSTQLTNFWPAGRNVPFPDDAVPQPLATASVLAKRAFLMSVIEGEGEKCDPVTTQCLTGQIADNYKTLTAGVNPTYYLHITALVPIAQDAGLGTTFTATGSGCTPQTLAQLVGGGGAALCIKSSDYQVIKNWPIAACGRVPGYGQVSGYTCGQPDAP